MVGILISFSSQLIDQFDRTAIDKVDLIFDKILIDIDLSKKNNCSIFHNKIDQTFYQDLAR